MAARVRVALLLFIVALVWVAALSPASAARTYRVKVGGDFPLYTFEPDEVHASVGDTVRWKNPSNDEHHVAFYDAPIAKTLHLDADGGRAALLLRKPGTYLYRCDIMFHSYLIGGECFGQCARLIVH
jgi:plastocyanin